MILALLMAFFAGSATVETIKYQDCKADHFKPGVCKFERSLKELSPKHE